MINRSLVRIALSTALVLTLALVPTALAGKGKPGGGTTTGGGSLSLVLMDGATQAAHMGRITFTVSSSSSRPFVGLRCYQGSDFVYDGYVGYFPDSLYDPWFTLDSPYWTPGVATSCSARLFTYDRRGNQIVQATLSFPVAP